MNQLVGALAAGIIAPMHITIICAESGGKARADIAIPSEQIITIPE